MLLDYCLARKERDIKEEFRWRYLNDLTCKIAQASNEGYRKLKAYSMIYKEIFEKGQVKEDNRTDEQIIEDTLKLFRK